MRLRNLAIILLSLTFLAAHAKLVGAAVVCTLDSDDTIVGEAQSGAMPQEGYYPGMAHPTIGVMGSQGVRRNQNRVFGFLLPQLGGAIQSATFTVRKTPTTTEPIRIDLWGLVTTNPDTSGTDLFLQSNTDPDHTKLFDNLITNNTPDYEVASSDVTAFIESLYSGGTPSQSEVFLRLNQDAVLSLGGYQTRMAVDQPTLTLTTIPEPTSLGLLCWTVALVTGLTTYRPSRTRRGK